MYLCLIFNVLLKDANALVNVLLPNDNQAKYKEVMMHTSETSPLHRALLPTQA